MRDKERVFVFVLAAAFAVFITILYGFVGLFFLERFNNYLVIVFTFFPFAITVANFMANNIVIRFKD